MATGMYFSSNKRKIVIVPEEMDVPEDGYTVDEQ